MSLIAHYLRHQSVLALFEDRVRFARRRFGHCRPCPFRERCQWHGTETKKPRRVSSVLYPIIETPKLDETPQALLATNSILWGDRERHSHRRELVKLLRSQRVDVRLAEMSPPAQIPPDRPLSRAERAHWRLSWAERLARNARERSAPCVDITLFGVPSAFLGLSTV